ncbi:MULTISPECIES: PadR family transcriptional regulator [Haloferax]|uniref:PadR family transcriptional regulator n=2 Tax=Haloferax TaxID=2251 RepID=A0A6G1Z121_9EURY|nr:MULTISPECIES: helix-turn-helix transcriptional regulator [Haloferax]KAB1187486.1 PadR family transcriptional regulator [Haloferax sp. CBA1149]MRW80138.1 PadR family transcriptional regulator [Haloferax marinisediminis]
MFALTGFQRDILYASAELTHPSGQDIKEHLIEITSLSDVNHGRLYPNLDVLVERGYLEKGDLDRRTNYYALSEKGEAAIRERRMWEDAHLEETNQMGPFG